jgi:glycosyltransferase involved in cell wall biosynthesis
MKVPTEKFAMRLQIEPKEISGRNVPRADWLDVAVLIPCYNEADTIRNTVRAFRRSVPSARIYVFDNNSRDGTAEIAAGAGAIVRRETAQGKGNVVRRMFSDIDAEVYVIVDGDETYDAEAAPRLLETLLSGPYDMVNVARKYITTDAYRTGHIFGNRLLTALVGLFFGTKTKDMLSGYKAFSRRFVKTFPAMSKGFEIETELMIHALDLRLPFAEIEAPYGARPEGSTSKLSMFRDGFRILKLLGWLLKHEKPLLFFSSLAGVLVVLSLSFGVPIVLEFLSTGLVPRLPTAVLAAAIMLSAVISLFTGLILDTVTHSRREVKRLHYLREQPPQVPAEATMANIMGLHDGSPRALHHRNSTLSSAAIRNER